MSLGRYSCSALLFCCLAVLPTPPLGAKTAETVEFCVLHQSGRQTVYVDDGDLFLNREAIGATRRGCLSAQVRCSTGGGSQTLEYAPHSLRAYGYRLRFRIKPCTNTRILLDGAQVAEINDLRWAVPYVNAITYPDSALKQQAERLTEKCKAGDTTCKVIRIYDFITKTLKYREDPLGNTDYIRSPYDTLNNRGGDCEDLTILMNSYLENVGVETYMVLTNNHAYGLACGVDLDRISAFAQRKFQQSSAYEKTLRLSPGSSTYLSSDSQQVLDIVDRLQISANYPVAIYTVPSRRENTKYTRGKPFSYLESCSHKSTTRYSRECRTNTRSGIIIANEGEEEVRVNLRYTTSYSSVDPKDISVASYQINTQNCVILESTAGKSGYPGYSKDTRGKKIFVNVETWKWIRQG